MRPDRGNFIGLDTVTVVARNTAPAVPGACIHQRHDFGVQVRPFHVGCLRKKKKIVCLFTECPGHFSKLLDKLYGGRIVCMLGRPSPDHTDTARLRRSILRLCSFDQTSADEPIFPKLSNLCFIHSLPDSENSKRLPQSCSADVCRRPLFLEYLLLIVLQICKG